jgi:hypothetical protein
MELHIILYGDNIFFTVFFPMSAAVGANVIKLFTAVSYEPTLEWSA